MSTVILHNGLKLIIILFLFQFFVVAALLAVAAADNAPYTTPAPAYKPTPAYHPRPAYKAPAHEQSYDEPAKYDFSYDVHGYGDYEPQFNAQEARDGYATQGSYSVCAARRPHPDGHLPCGRRLLWPDCRRHLRG